MQNIEQKKIYEPVQFNYQLRVKVFLNNTDQCFPAHWHVPLELLMPLENNYIVECEGGRIEVKEKEIVLIAPGMVHALEAPPDGKRLFLQADLSLFSQIKEIDRIFSSIPPILVIKEKQEPDIYHLAAGIIERAGNEKFEENICNNLQIYSDLLRLIAAVGKNIPDCFKEYEEKKTGTFDFRMKEFRAVCDYICLHCEEDLTLETMADKVGFNKYYFAHLFRKFVGIPFHRYLNKQRILKAQRLLVNPECTIASAAMQSGYSSISAFNRMFKQIRGCTPREFRNMYVSVFDTDLV